MSEALTEAEFDRRWLVRRALARTMLKRAAEMDDLKEAYRTACDAAKMLSFLPDKASCKRSRCKHCHGGTWSQDNKPIYWMNQIVYIDYGPLLCTKCGAPAEDMEIVYKVEKGRL